MLEQSVKTLYRVKEDIIQVNRENFAILMKSNDCMLLLIVYLSDNSAYSYQLFAIKVKTG